MSSSLESKLDRIMARAEELRFMLSGSLSGEDFVKASKELSELTPVEEQISALRGAEKQAKELEALLADPDMKELAEAELHDLKKQQPDLEMAVRLALLPKDEADDRSAILEIRPARGRRRGGSVRRRALHRVPAICRAAGLALRGDGLRETELGGVKEGDGRDHRPIRLRQAEIRIRRAPRAARARNRDAGAHPYLDHHRRRAAGSRGSRCRR